MKNNKIAIFGAITLFSLILSINFVFPFAISSPYMKDKQFYLMPGDSSTLSFLLQNSGGNDVKVTANIASGDKVSRIIDKKEVYEMTAGSDLKIDLEVRIPSNATIGEKYPVVIGFDVKPNVPNQALSFGSSFNQNFEIVVGVRPGEEEPKKKPINWIIILVLLILILALIIIIINYLSKKKKKKEFKVKKGKR